MIVINSVFESIVDVMNESERSKRPGRHRAITVQYEMYITFHRDVLYTIHNNRIQFVSYLVQYSLN